MQNLWQRIGLFHTPQAILWNIRTLGFGSWLRCEVENVGHVATEQYHALTAGKLARKPPQQAVRLRLVTRDVR